MDGDPGGTYRPLNTLKAVVRNVWIVDGPVIRFGMPWPRMPFPTRMTVIRLGAGLFLHSPTQLTPRLKLEIAATGRPCWIIGPSRIHYWWIPDWHTAFPEAAVYLAPRTKERAGTHMDLDGRPLASDGGYPWDAEMATLPVAGRYMTEVVFFHRASRTLVLTDLIENFEPRRLGSYPLRWLVGIAGALDPDGSMPRDMRMTYPRATLRAAVETMIGWDPERVILAHGRWYERDGTAELRRAFRWLLR
jgi:hypothetical protein